jgi:rfaE bifunctional protein kinase chain/domain
MRVDQARVRALSDRFGSLRLLVVGDVMLDQFLMGRVNRISPEAPVPVVEFETEQFRLGGAANVANNARALGAAVDLVGVVGHDPTADRLRQDLADRGIPPAGLVTASDRPTTRKVRVVTTRNQQVARVDYESNAEVSHEVGHALKDRIGDRLGGASIVVVSDYQKGVVTAGLMSWLAAETAARGLPLVVDPKVRHLDIYAGASLVTPNHHEAEAATAMRIRSVADVRAAAREIQRRARCESVLVTWGEQGMWWLEGRWADSFAAARTGEVEVVSEGHLPALPRDVADVTGAGDTVIATVALGLGAGATLAEAATLANHAAGVVVGHFGPAAVTPEELVGSFATHA